LNGSESVGVRNDAVVFRIRADHMFARLERQQRQVHRRGARRDDKAVDVLHDRTQPRRPDGQEEGEGQEDPTDRECQAQDWEGGEEATRAGVGDIPSEARGPDDDRVAERH
jgi:hypothetical protein